MKIADMTSPGWWIEREFSRDLADHLATTIQDELAQDEQPAPASTPEPETCPTCGWPKGEAVPARYWFVSGAKWCDECGLYRPSDVMGVFASPPPSPGEDAPVCTDCGMAHAEPIEIDDHGSTCDGPYPAPPPEEGLDLDGLWATVRKGLRGDWSEADAPYAALDRLLALARTAELMPALNEAAEQSIARETRLRARFEALRDWEQARADVLRWAGTASIFIRGTCLTTAEWYHEAEKQRAALRTRLALATEALEEIAERYPDDSIGIAPRIARTALARIKGETDE